MTARGMTPWIVVPLACVAIGAGLDDAERAYREGRVQAARERFVAEWSDAGESASEELLLAVALSSVATSELVDAEVAAERLAMRGGPARYGDRDQIVGAVEFVRCERAAAQARRVEAEPFAFDLAILHAERARASFEAAARREPAPASAARNVERALRMLEALRRERDAKEQQRRKEADAEKPRPDPPENPNDAEDQEREAGEERAVRPQLLELSAAQVRALFDKLDRQEETRRALRRERRAAQTDVERDW